MTSKRCCILVACIVLGAAAAGCGGGSKVLRLTETVADFDTQVLKADKPVLVDFYKEGCAACAALEPTMDRLATEYDGRVLCASFRAYTMFFGVPSEEIKKKYDIVFTPTVILFVGGKEKQRWSMDYDGNAYRKVLDEVAPPPPPPDKSKAGKPAAR